MSSLPAPPSFLLSDYGLGLAAELDPTEVFVKEYLQTEDIARQDAFNLKKALQGEVSFHR